MKPLHLRTALIILAILTCTTGILPGQPTENFDVYLFEVRSKTVSQVSSVKDAGEFNPSFSPSGRFIVHDVFVPATGTQDLYVTSTRTGESKPLKGGEGGNDASWSPLEFLIAFDRATAGDLSIYTVCFFGPLPFGGDRKMIRANAVNPDWSPFGTRLVFTDITDGSIKTIGLFDHKETTVVPFGFNPAWSRDGRYIAYGDGSNLFRIKVNFFGQPVSAPEQLTFDNPANTYNSGPTWSHDSKYIVFSSNRETDNFDFDIWTVRADGGVPKRLTGSQNKGDFDPAFSKNGKFVAYAGSTEPDVLALHQENSFRLSQNFPNPLLTQTTISFELPERSDVLVEIRDHNNKLIKTLTRDEYAQGQHAITWDRTNQNGEKVSSGYYYYTIRTPGFRQVKRLVIED